MRDSGSGRAHALRWPAKLCSLGCSFFLIATSTWGQSPQTAVTREAFSRKLVAAAIERTHHRVRYVSDYVSIPYPGGDVPADTGVCTDEIVRIYRAVEIDLQKEVHEDMIRNFNLYPHKWRTHPGPNIDHRRVPNLMTFSARKGQTLPSTTRSTDYSAGDIVA